MANWQKFGDPWNQGSFVTPVPAPDAEPGAAPTLCVQFNASWLPYILGAMFQLTQPSAWDPASSGYADVLQQAQGLMAIFSEAEVCTDMLQFQFTDTCGLQYSVDGGVTWIDVPGWDTFASTCFTGPEGPEGPIGPPGTFTPGTPGNPQGVGVPQQACNVAGYLATEIIEGAISGIVDQVNAAEDLVAAVTAVFQLIPGIDVVWDIAVGAGAVLYKLIRAQGTAEYTAALGDPTLWSDVTCAIYSATSADGYVTDANYAAVAAAIAAISYTSPDVIATIAAYVDALGAAGVEALQITGALAVVDCSGCGSAPANSIRYGSGFTGSLTLNNGLNFGAGPWSIAMWIWTTQTATATLALLLEGPGCYYTEQLNNAGPAFVDVRGADCVDHVITGGTINDGAAHLVVFTATPGTDQHIIVDGTDVATAALAPTGTWSGSRTPTFGQGNFADLEGYMWGMAVYIGTALSAGDAAGWFAAGPNSAPPGTPDHYWPCDEGEGTTAADVISGNFGTLSGTPTWAVHP